MCKLVVDGRAAGGAGAGAVGSTLSWRERVVAVWFGPKGFSSVFYALLIVQARVPQAEQLLQVAAVVITASMILSSSTDVLIVRWFRRAQGAP